MLVGGRVGQQLTGRTTELRGEVLDDGSVLVPLVEQLREVTTAPGVDLRVGPRIGADALEVARHDVGGDPDEVREQVVHRPLGGGRRDRGQSGGVGVRHELTHAQSHTPIRLADLVHTSSLEPEATDGLQR